MTSEILTYLIGFAIIVVFTKLIRWYLKHQEYSKVINKIPGPTSYPLIGSMTHFINVPRSERFYVVKKWSETYPDIFRVWIGMQANIFVSNPEYIERLIGSTKHIEKSPGYNFLLKWLGRGLLTSFGDRWHKHRKILTPTFHFSILDTFCSIFGEQSIVLVNCLKEYSDTGKPLDIFPYITRATLDTICETAMGVKLNAQTGDKNNEYVTAVHNFSALFSKRRISPWLNSDLVFYSTAMGREYQKAIDTLHKFSTTIIAERKMARKSKECDDNVESDDLGKKKKLAFLDLLLEANENNHQLTDTDIREEVDTFMFEGHDTTAAGISWTLFFLGLNADVQEKAFQELDEIFQGSDRLATMKDLNEMKYLERVIKESLRLRPPVPFFSRTTSEDEFLGKYFVPKGTFVSINTYYLHRNEKYFPDPDKFDPDRFANDSEKYKSVEKHPFAYIPFSAGPRNCIGQKFALLEEKSLLSGVIRNYKIKSVQKREDVHICSEMIARPYEGIKVLLEKRL
uniref:Putative cytochrome n=1 Tax=Corethrella appendiculata TaxID=1370023 RepID=U5EWR0_9DIPT